jgi:predicted nucleic acid-binding protein
MKRVVVDAGVTVNWQLPFPQNEADVDKALALFEKIAQSDAVMNQPPHFLAEIMAVVARLKPDYADAISIAVSNLEMTISDEPGLYQTAIRLSVELNHHLFDTLYHATALTSQETTLITGDEAYYRKAKEYE